MLSRVRHRLSPLASVLDKSPLFTPSETHGKFREILRSFVAKEVEPQALIFNREEKLNLPLLRKLGDLGLHGVCVAEEDGGSGLDATAFVIAHEELSFSDPGLCLGYLAHSSLFVNNLYHNGNQAQKDKWLRPAISGEIIGGMGMSEANSGTDVLSMKTHAKVDGSGFILNGSKMWITNGCFDDNTLGDIFLVYAKTDNGLSLFLVEGKTPGFKLGQKIKDKCGMRASATAELIFDNVHVPAFNLIGEEGKGLVPMMRNLEIERVVLAGMALGISRRCLEVMVNYSAERSAFGKKISSFGQIQRHIAESFAEYQAARSYVYMTASQINLAEPGGRLDSDGVKLFATNAAKNIADRAIQVLGGNGYVGDYVVERLWRDAKLLEIGGGTIEAHQKNITKDLVDLVK